MSSLPQPADSQPLAKVYEHMRRLADGIQSARDTIVYPAGGPAGEKTITFAKPFAAVPTVTVTTTHGGDIAGRFVLGVHSVTTSSCVVRVRRIDGSTSAFNGIQFNYQAIGTPA